MVIFRCLIYLTRLMLSLTHVCGRLSWVAIAFFLLAGKSTTVVGYFCS
jgi:hypothetical protein